MSGGRGDNSSGDIEHSGTLSSDGFKTSTGDQEIVLDKPVNSFRIVGETDSDIFFITVNGETNTHRVTNKRPYGFNGLTLYKFTIIEAGIRYEWDALVQ